MTNIAFSMRPTEMREYLAIFKAQTFSYLYPLSNTFQPRPLPRKLHHIELLQLLPRQKSSQQFPPRAPTRLQLFPQRLIRIELVHQPLRKSLFRWKIVIRIHHHEFYSIPESLSIVSFIEPTLPRIFRPLLMPITPITQLLQQRPQRPPILRQRIFDLQRNLAVNLSRHNAIPFQLAQMLRQHLARDARDESLQFAEAPHTALEPPKNQRLPFAADDR